MVRECKVYVCDRCGRTQICKHIGNGPTETTDLDGYELLPIEWGEPYRYGGRPNDQTVHLCPSCNRAFQILLRQFWKEDSDAAH